MKLSVVALSLVFFNSAWGASEKVPLLLDAGSSKSKGNVVYLEELPSADVSPSILHFRAGTTSLNDLRLANSYYRFDYPQGIRSQMFSLGWETTPIRFLGRWGWRGDLAYGSYSSSFKLSNNVSTGQSHLNVLPLTAGIVYLADYHPIMKWFMPALEAGIGYYSYFQTGDVDGAQTQGGALTTHFSLGLRHSLAWMGWQNSQLTMDYSRTSRTSDSQVDFSGDTFLLGFAASI